MSFDLHVLAIDPDASDDAVRAMVDRCQGDAHAEGELDQRIVDFYESLRRRYPDFPPYPDDSPWMSMPLDVGVDHVCMSMSFSSSDDVIYLIFDLAQQYELTVYDPQDDSVARPGDD
ncbi:hypothetical protein [Krasilnikovia cinnamomea]|uniref:hypothetical protein n=1 Tax=Krasilnikovia cinnamomea TaxID=349313 RepID=UPI001F5EC003|nr:hypothetical protein [Krasilnikovia cinnamomea]